MDDYLVTIKGLELEQWFGDVSPTITRIARMAINRVLDSTRTKVDRMIRQQVAFPASYLAPGQQRLFVSQRASNATLAGTILGRTRPTSLARFTKDKPLNKGSSAARRRKGVTVIVKPGVARFIKGAFLIPLRNGNTGLAIRSATIPRGAYKPQKLGKNLWLLYGPSVAQVLHSDRNQGGVADDVVPIAAEDLKREFWRLYNVEMSRA